MPYIWPYSHPEPSSGAAERGRRTFGRANSRFVSCLVSVTVIKWRKGQQSKVAEKTEGVFLLKDTPGEDEMGCVEDIGSRHQKALVALLALNLWAKACFHRPCDQAGSGVSDQTRRLGRKRCKLSLEG